MMQHGSSIAFLRRSLDSQKLQACAHCRPSSWNRHKSKTAARSGQPKLHAQLKAAAHCAATCWAVSATVGTTSINNLRLCTWPYRQRGTLPLASAPALNSLPVVRAANQTWRGVMPDQLPEE